MVENSVVTGVSTPTNSEDIRDSTDVSLARFAATVRGCNPRLADELLINAVLSQHGAKIEFNESASAWFAEADAWRQTSDDWEQKFRASAAACAFLEAQKLRLKIYLAILLPATIILFLAWVVRLAPVAR